MDLVASMKRVLENTLGRLLAAVITLATAGVVGAAINAWSTIQVSPGAVIAFDTDKDKGCPDGWRKHDRAAGRVIVGVQQQPPGGMRHFEFGERDGDHEHVISKPTAIHSGSEALQLELQPTMPPGMPRVISEKIDNMPPYIGLGFCTPD